MNVRINTGIWSLVLLISLFSCKGTAESIPNEAIKTEVTGTRALVTTRFQDEGCEVLLEIEEDGEKVLLLPINLEDSFKVDGAVLDITFHFSRIMQSECQEGRPIVLDSVKLIDRNN